MGLLEEKNMVLPEITRDSRLEGHFVKGGLRKKLGLTNEPVTNWIQSAQTLMESVKEGKLIPAHVNIGLFLDLANRINEMPGMSEIERSVYGSDIPPISHISFPNGFIINNVSRQYTEGRSMQLKEIEDTLHVLAGEVGIKYQYIFDYSVKNT